jgi:hypothetical protein
VSALLHGSLPEGKEREDVMGDSDQEEVDPRPFKEVVEKPAEADTPGEQDALHAVSALAEASGRTNLENLATEFTRHFKGANGMATILSAVAFDPSTRPATRIKIIQTVTSVIDRASKTYGDNRNLENIPTPMVKKRLVDLLKEHNYVVPIPGVKLDG